MKQGTPRLVAIVIALSIACQSRLLVADGLTLAPELQAAEAARVAAIAKASAPTVAVFAPDKTAGGGSGVLISADGYALTNFHVVQPCGAAMKCGLNDGNLYDAVVVGIDPTGDLALIQLLGRQDFPVAEWGDSDELQVGDPCFAVGNPFLLATDYRPTVTYGVISGLRRYQPPAVTAILEYTDCIQTDAAINPGNSGGPLFNAQGQLIGINGRGSFEKRGRVNVGVGYAISLTQVKNFLGVLHSGRVVDHATLGATVSTRVDGVGVEVSNLLESSDAYRRGLRYGDEILELAGRSIDSANTLKNVLGILPRDWRVPLAYRQDDEIRRTWVRLAGVHSPEVLLALAQKGLGDEPPRRPEPPPEDAPAPDSEQDGEAPRPEAPRVPRPHGQTEAASSPLPPAVAARYVERHGFANYFYNRQERDRVWNGYQKTRSGWSDPVAWRLTGDVGGGGNFAVTLADQQIAFRWNDANGSQEAAMDLAQELAVLREPQGSGGLFLLLSLWRRLDTLGPDRFGDVVYWGTAPLPRREGMFDVLVATYDVLEARLYFSPQSGELVAMELFPDEEVDPCEVYFDDYGELQGQRVPRQLTVLHADQTFAELRITDFSRLPSADKEAR